MIPTEIANRFNEIRALIFLKSPQVKDQNGYIVTLDEHGNTDAVVAELGASDSFERLCKAIQTNPLNVILVEQPHNPEPTRFTVLEKDVLWPDLSITTDFCHAYMLP